MPTSATRFGLNLTLKYRGRLICDMLQGLINQGDDVLDVGCGNGVISHMIQREMQCNVTGTDMLEYLEKPIAFRPMTKNKYGYQLPFHPDGMWDVGLLIDVLHHVTTLEQQALIIEATRQVRRLVIIEPKLNKLLPCVDFIVNHLRNPEMPIALTFRSLEGWLSIVGDCTWSQIKSPFPWPFDYYRMIIHNKEAR